MDELATGARLQYGRHLARSLTAWQWNQSKQAIMHVTKGKHAKTIHKESLLSRPCLHNVC